LALRAYGVPDVPSFPTNLNELVSLRAACTNLLAKPLDEQSLQHLVTFSLNASNPVQLRSEALAVCVMSKLAKGETNLFTNGRNFHKANFPNDEKLLEFGAYTATCKTCGGTGTIETPLFCKTCNNTGKCAYKDCDNGKWITIRPGPNGHARETSPLSCPVCKGTGKCQACGGVSVERKKCPTCNGSKEVFRRPLTLGKKYESLLSDMIATVTETLTVDERLKLALGQKDPENRARLLSGILHDFPNHPASEKIRHHLQETFDLMHEQANVKALAEKRHEDIMGLLRGQSASGDGKTVILALEEHLKSCTNCPNKVEIGILKGNCEKRIIASAERKRVLYIVGCLLILLFGVSCIHINFFKYTLLPASSATAARRPKPGADQFTDPLALTAKDSRGRVKNKTSRIPMPDEPGTPTR